MIPEELKNTIHEFLEHCKEQEGKWIKITSALSNNADNFDRHFTSFSSHTYQLQSFGVRFSGARVMFYGKIQSYEIGMDMILGVQEKAADQFEILEKLSETVYRRTVLHFLMEE